MNNTITKIIGTSFFSIPYQSIATTEVNCKICLKRTTLSMKYNSQSHMDICKVYNDHFKANCIGDEFKQQLKHDILNEVKMFF
jgi:hypothetical protein